MITVEIFGRSFTVPREIDNDAAASQAWADDIRARLVGALRDAGEAPRILAVPVYDAPGQVKVGLDGEVVTQAVEEWDAVPEAVFATFLAQAAPQAPAAVVLEPASPADVVPSDAEGA